MAVQHVRHIECRILASRSVLIVTWYIELFNWIFNWYKSTKRNAFELWTWLARCQLMLYNFNLNIIIIIIIIILLYSSVSQPFMNNLAICNY